MLVRCLHCHEPIELVDDSDLRHVACSSCGGSFNLVGEDTLSWSAETMRQLGPFELIQPVGGGAFGTVWKARDTRLDRIVAIKVPRKGQLNAEESEQFLREARHAAQLKHPSIVAVHEVGRDNETVYIVSDFVHGVTLDDWLTGHTPSPREAAQLCVEIAEALHHAHEAGVIHRDLKPSNVMLDKEGHPFLMDFGLSRREVGEISMTVDGQILGTPAYMSPEQAEGKSHGADRRSDTYSLGVILFRMLTGELPFRGSAPMIMHQKQTEDASSLRRLNGRIPRDLDTICLKCLERDLRKRYATAQVLTADLKRWLNGEPIRARAISKAGRVWRWCKRNPMTTVLTMAVVAVLIGGTAVSAYLAIARNEEAKAAEAARKEAVIAQEETRQQLYIQTMNSAGEAFFQNNFARARRLHENFEDSDLRQFEWRWLQKAMTPLSLADEIEVPHGVASVCFSPLGDRVAFGLRNGNVFVFDWKQKSGQSYGSSDLFWTSNPVVFLDEHQVVYCEANKILRIDLRTRATGLVGDHPGDVVQLAASGNLLLSACRAGEVRLWKMDTAIPPRIYPLTAGWNSVAISPNGDFLAAGDGDGVIWVWKSDGLDEPLVKIRGHLWVSTLSFSPSAELLASGGSDGTMKVWSWQEKAEIFRWGHSDRLLSVHFAASGDRLLACDRAGAVTLWAVNLHETKDRQFVKTATIRRQSSGTYGALSPRGDMAAVGGFDRRAMLWDLTKLEQDESTLFAGRRISNVQFLSGTRHLVVAHDALPSLGHADLPPVDATVVVWDCEKRQPVRELAKDSCRSMVTSSKGMIAIGTNEEKVVLWDTKDSFSLSAPQELVGYPGPLAFSPDGEILAAASLDGHVRLWNVKERRVEGRTLVSPVAELAALSISPSKSKLAVGANGGQVAVLNLLSGAVDRTCSGHWSRVSSLSFSPDDRWLASASWDRSIRLWDMRTRRDEGYSLDGHNLWVSSVLFSPDSRTIFSASGDRTIRIWDVGTRQMRFTLRDHEAPLHGLDLSSDGNLLVAGGHDGQVRFWKASE